jgi:hypothetical protein
MNRGLDGKREAQRAQIPGAGHGIRQGLRDKIKGPPPEGSLRNRSQTGRFSILDL